MIVIFVDWMNVGRSGQVGCRSVQRSERACDDDMMSASNHVSVSIFERVLV